jgi:hypothetical protein
MLNLKNFVKLIDLIIYFGSMIGIYLSAIAITKKVKEVNEFQAVLLIMGYIFVVSVIVHFIKRDRHGK